MMIDCDLSALEWRVGAEISRDPIMIEEIVNGVDIHTANAVAIFGDAKYRQESKTVSFRSLYGGSAYAFHVDPRMPKLGKERWEQIAEDFYAKYKGLRKWQEESYRFVTKHGWYQSFTGRRYHFQKVRKFDGTYEYPWPSVCNYMVQGTATGDIVPLVLVNVFPKLRRVSSEIKLINQVHDSIVLDAPDKYVSDVCEICLQAFQDIPKLVKKHYNYDWVVPMAGEATFGNDWSSKTKYEREPF